MTQDPGCVVAGYDGSAEAAAAVRRAARHARAARRPLQSESDCVDAFLDNGVGQSLMIASRIAETLARRRQECQRPQEHQYNQIADEAEARLAAERSAAHAALAPVHKVHWWDKAQPADLATAPIAVARVGNFVEDVYLPASSRNPT